MTTEALFYEGADVIMTAKLFILPRIGENVTLVIKSDRQRHYRVEDITWVYQKDHAPVAEIELEKL